MKLTGKIVAALFLIFIWGAIEGSAIPSLADWSSAELIGYNVWTLLTLGVAIFIIYKIWMKKPKGD